MLSQRILPARGAPFRNAPADEYNQPLPILERSESLLASTSRLLQGYLEIWTEDARPAGPCPSLGICQSCLRLAPGMVQACWKWRGNHGRTASHGGESVEWACPRRVRLLALPIPGPDQANGSLIWLDPSQAKTPGDARDREPVAGTIAMRSLPAPKEAAAFDDGAKRAFLSDLARLLSDQVFFWREMQALSGELSTRCDELQMLYSIAGRLTSYDDLRQSLRQMLEQARLTLEADAAFLTMRERPLRDVVTHPDLPEPPGGYRRIWRRFAEALPRILDAADSRFYIGSAWDPALGPSPFPGPAQTLAVRVLRQGKRDGCLALVLFDPAKSFRSSDIRLLESLAEQISLAVSNAELFDDLQGFLMATVKSLVSAIEAKDSYTSGHSERVNLLSMLIGKKLDLPAAEMETLRWASILHDVGKIGMPETILQKPCKLTPQEFEIIKEHPDRGFSMLSPIRQLAEAARSVRAHHEMYNGNGYPCGLSGDSIPLLARIISIADTFDAMTSSRPYRNARTMEHAMSEIRRVRGSQLDPRLVDCFLELAPFLREHSIMINASTEMVTEEAA